MMVILKKTGVDGGTLWCAVILAGLWWVLAGGSAASWMVGIPVIVLATAMGAARRGPRLNLCLPGVLRFCGYFLVASVRGGVDVMCRVLMPGLPIDPDLHRYRLRLPEGSARIFFTAVVSLLPGTLSVELEQDELILHVLDIRLPIERELARLETRVAAIFAMELPARSTAADA